MKMPSRPCESELTIKRLTGDNSRIIFVDSSSKHRLRPSLEPSHQADSNEGSQLVFKEKYANNCIIIN